jgi:hypothetical protein
MARKETPDLLGELLSGPSEPDQTPTADRSSLPTTRSQPSSAPSQTEPEVASWDYLLVSFSHYHGWRPRYINGREIQQWMQAPLIHDYVNDLGEDGWELVGASNGKSLYGIRDTYQLYFKRRRH